MPRKNKEKYNKYMREYMLKRYHKQRNDAIKLLGGKCVQCESTENLELDHIDPAQKSFGLGKGYSCSKKHWDTEVTKCQVLCKTCHKIKSGIEMTGRPPPNKVTNYGHGTGHMYKKDRCKCDKCRKWKRLYRNKLVDYMGLKL